MNNLTGKKVTILVNNKTITGVVLNHIRGLGIILIGYCWYSEKDVISIWDDIEE